MSAPNASGFWLTGVEKTLSTIRQAPAAWASSATAARSMISRVGLDGVSRKTQAAPGASAAFQASGSVPSINTVSMPKRGRISAMM